MSDWWSRRVDEISNDRVLQVYGAALSLVNGLAAIHWLLPPTLAQILAVDEPPICWPFWLTCGRMRIFSAQAWTVAAFALLVGASLNARFFWLGRIKPALWLLLVLSAIKLAIVFQDFRLTLNHHYMSTWVVAVYLMSRNKRITVPVLIVTMYVWAGVLKVLPDSQWLSGAAFYGRRPLNLPSSAIPLACGYVVFLELCVSWGLLSTFRWARLLALAQFFIFHVASWWVVGWFYPSVMFLLLSLFMWPHTDWRPTIATGSGDARWARQLQYASCALLFSLAQLPPLAIPGDSAVTGEGRIFSLNMFDAPVDCRAHVAWKTNGRVVTHSLSPQFLNTRLWCDPLIYYQAALAVCKRLPPSAVPRDIHVVLESRKYGDLNFQPVVDLESFCSRPIEYRVFGHNWWIRGG